MARRSVDRRLDKLLDVILPPGSFERRAHELPPEMKQALELYQTKVAAIILRAEKSDSTPGAAFARLLDGDLILPQMPQALKQALGLVDPPEITEAMSLTEISDLYQRYVEGTEQ